MYIAPLRGDVLQSDWLKAVSTVLRFIDCVCVYYLLYINIAWDVVFNQHLGCVSNAMHACCLLLVVLGLVYLSHVMSSLPYPLVGTNTFLGRCF